MIFSLSTILIPKSVSGMTCVPIAKIRAGTVPIEQIKIEVEHVDDIPISLTIGKMAKSTGRVYLTVKGTENPKDNDLILFRIMTPLKTEEQVLPVAVIR